MHERKHREGRKTVTSSLNEKSTDQLTQRVVGGGGGGGATPHTPTPCNSGLLERYLKTTWKDFRIFASCFNVKTRSRQIMYWILHCLTLAVQAVVWWDRDAVFPLAGPGRVNSAANPGPSQAGFLAAAASHYRRRHFPAAQGPPSMARGSPVAVRGLQPSVSPDQTGKRRRRTRRLRDRRSFRHRRKSPPFPASRCRTKTRRKKRR